MREVSCGPNAYYLMESTRSIGYSIKSAIADIIDNSIAADAKHVEIFHDAFPEPYLAIADDGCGMNDQELNEAMRYGGSGPDVVRSSKDLGRYGLGLKTASLSQCRKLTVISKKNNAVYARQWDIDYVRRTNDWSLLILDRDEIAKLPKADLLNNKESGTIVIWQELDKFKRDNPDAGDLLTEEMDKVGKHLSLVFHRYLSHEAGLTLSISINNNTLKPFDPFFTKKSVKMQTEQIYIPHRKGFVEVTPYILPHPSRMTTEERALYSDKNGMRSFQGFYIYRNRRLIIWGTWFEMAPKNELSKLARVQVDTPNSLDDLWRLDIKKSTASPPDTVKKRLKKLVTKIIEPSTKTFEVRKRKEISDDRINVWNMIQTRDGDHFELNQDYPLLKVLKERLDKVELELLENYINIIQKNLPYNNIYVEMNKDKIVETEEDDNERKSCLNTIRSAMKLASERGTLDEAYSTLIKTTPFADYEKEITEIYNKLR